MRVHLYGEPAAYHGDDTYAARLAPLLARPYVRRHGQPHTGRIPRRPARARRAGHAVGLAGDERAGHPRGACGRRAGGRVAASAALPRRSADGVNGLLVAPGDVDDSTGAWRGWSPSRDCWRGCAPASRRSADASSDDVAPMRERYADGDRAGRARRATAARLPPSSSTTGRPTTLCSPSASLLRLAAAARPDRRRRQRRRSSRAATALGGRRRPRDLSPHRPEPRVLRVA